MVRKEFAVHILNDEGIARAKEIAAVMSEALDKVESLMAVDPLTSAGAREAAIVRTKFEEAGFYAKKAMCLNTNHQHISEHSHASS